MEWREMHGGLAKRFALGDGTQVVGLVEVAEEDVKISFFADRADIEGIEAKSEKLGGLFDFIDDLRPQDVIDICCAMDGLQGNRKRGRS